MSWTFHHFVPAISRASWQRSHLYVPTPWPMGDRLRVFAAMLDEGMIGRLGYVDLDLEDVSKPLKTSLTPALDVGEAGAFDEHGVTPLCLVAQDSSLRLYYAGWQRNEAVRHLLFTGLAESQDGGESFSRYQNTPVIDRAPGMPRLRTGGAVIYHRNVWWSWYAEESGEFEREGKRLPRYHWSVMTSPDGIHWPEKGQACFEADERIFGYGRSWVGVDARGFYAWVSARHVEGYRIGYTRSDDGIKWKPLDYDRGLMPGGHPQALKQVCFPSVVDLPSGRYMFYNGDEYGRAGFFIARWKE